jgi:hypothetical protein
MRNLKNDHGHLGLRMPRKTGRLAQNAAVLNHGIPSYQRKCRGTGSLAALVSSPDAVDRREDLGSYIEDAHPRSGWRCHGLAIEICSRPVLTAMFDRSCLTEAANVAAVGALSAVTALTKTCPAVVQSGPSTSARSANTWAAIA